MKYMFLIIWALLEVICFYLFCRYLLVRRPMIRPLVKYLCDMWVPCITRRAHKVMVWWRERFL